MTDEEFEKELDKMYDELDQKQAEMEELGLIMYGDTSYYLRNPEEYEKDKRICELESKIEKLEIRASKNFNAYMKCSKKYTNLIDENLKLKNELGITQKAYKIAIFELDFAKHHSQSTSQETVDRIEKLESEIWNKAKEKMKSE